MISKVRIIYRDECFGDDEQDLDAELESIRKSSYDVSADFNNSDAAIST